MTGAQAQPPFGAGASAPPVTTDPAVMFRNQCGTCHATRLGGPQLQGPNLAGIYQRRAATVAGFKYSPALAKADFAWDDARMDAWLTNPQAMVPGAIMVYRQANPDTRKTIIDWLKEQH